MQPQDSLKLQDFVDSSKSKGATDEFLAALLTRRDWPAADVYAALGKYWEHRPVSQSPSAPAPESPPVTRFSTCYRLLRSPPGPRRWAPCFSNSSTTGSPMRFPRTLPGISGPRSH